MAIAKVIEVLAVTLLDLVPTILSQLQTLAVIQNTEAKTRHKPPLQRYRPIGVVQGLSRPTQVLDRVAVMPITVVDTEVTPQLEDQALSREGPLVILDEHMVGDNFQEVLPLPDFIVRHRKVPVQDRLGLTIIEGPRRTILGPNQAGSQNSEAVMGPLNDGLRRRQGLIVSIDCFNHG